MLKMAARGSKDGKPHQVVILGLSHVNLERLKAGEPIAIDGAELGLENTEIMIFAGETERAMAREIESLIFVGETRLRVDPRLRD